jgi:hypothetical protein
MFHDPTGTGNKIGSTGEFVRACIFPFQKGYRVNFVVTNYKVAGTGIEAGILGGITRAIKGDEKAVLEKFILGMVDKVKAKAPNTLVESIDLPGAQRRAPDAEAVQALLPNGPAKPAVPQVLATAPPVSPAGGVASQGPAAARKELTAMGLTYHSLDQFVAAVRRKDVLAVRLFVDGGGVDPTAKDSSGKSARDIAQDLGDPAMLAVLAPAAATSHPAVAVSTAAQSSSAAMPPAREVTLPALPPMQRAMLGQLDDAQLDAQATNMVAGLPQDQRAPAKRQIIEQVRGTGK